MSALPRSLHTQIAALAHGRLWHEARSAEMSATHVRFRGVGSTGRRNTGVKSLCWGFKLQGLTWSFV